MTDNGLRLQKVTEQSRDNPIYSAICPCTVSFCGDMPQKDLDKEDLSACGLASVVLNGLTDPAIGLMKLLLEWPRVVEGAPKRRPHRIAPLGEVAAGFHGCGTKARRYDVEVLVDNDLALTMARLALVRATQTVIASGLQSLGSSLWRNCAHNLHSEAPGTADARAADD